MQGLCAVIFDRLLGLPWVERRRARGLVDHGDDLVGYSTARTILLANIRENSDLIEKTKQRLWLGGNFDRC